jgi:hypothetical protein
MTVSSQPKSALATRIDRLARGDRKLRSWALQSMLGGAREQKGGEGRKAHLAEDHGGV